MATDKKTDACPLRLENSEADLEKTPGEHWRWCPQCGHELHNEKCKLRCPRCHYFMSCSDFTEVNALKLSSQSGDAFHIHWIGEPATAFERRAHDKTIGKGILADIF